MTRRINLLALPALLVCALIFPGFALPQDNSPLADQLIRQGIRRAILQDFEGAFSAFEQLQRHFPTHPAGYFYQAATLQSQMLDYEEDFSEEEFLRQIRRTISLCDSLIRQNPRDARAYFYKGGALSYLGLHWSRKKRWFSAFRSALKGVHNLEKAVELDSTLYDAYLGIGTFKYWRSRLTRFLTWLPFVSDERQKGIRLIQKAIRGGRYSQAAAINELVWIYLDQGRWKEAIEWSKRGLQDYPGSRFFLWPLAEAYFRSGRYREAIQTYQEILDSWATEIYNNGYNDLICYLRIAVSYLNLGQYQRVIDSCKKAFELKLAKTVQKRARKKLTFLRKLEARARELMRRQKSVAN